ncbi:hypothetical protein QVD17_27861 [Tagetes erecta]|uniref:Disease resistance R13L4/SHOC-2-like LRR domain-containing protein n=1 Tax=Tagetes erecta TaxID=13708 RepID=A0AAD8K9B3_TARER|nr:hypothetical protein QVD17_27861 [Tagetes erecta]
MLILAIGRLLRAKANGEEWDDVLNSEIWDLENAFEIIPAFRLSYHDLSSDLKRVFAYCSLFPKGFLFDKDELVFLWMAEGLNKEIEITEATLAKYRHISFIREKYVGYQKFEAFKRARSLRTFIATSVGMVTGWDFFYLSTKILVLILPELPLLRVLCLSCFRIDEVPNCIGSLEHLRYLSLSQTKIRELPENVGNLCNLQTLIVSRCKSLTKLPKSFLKLKNLRHFDIRNTPLLKKLPLGIGELKNLHTLTKFIIKEDFAITNLKGLTNLQGEISIEGLHKVQSAMHAREANLSKKRLTKLELKGGYALHDYRRGTLENEVLNELKPCNEKLKELAIVSYGGIEFPNWVGDTSFRHLVEVLIYNCEHCTSLPPLGRLPSLKKLFIQGMNNVKVIGLDFTGTTFVAFPSLEILTFKYMPGWEVWSTNNVVFDAVFPCLRELHIKKCPKLIDVSLEALPLLKVLEIDACGDTVLRSLACIGSSITKLEIRSISCLTGEAWRCALEYLGAVEEISMWNCNEVRNLWESKVEASKVLVNLKKLNVHQCDNLVSLGGTEEGNFRSNLPSSLMMLEISSCRSLKRCCCPNSIESLGINSCSSVTNVSFPTTTRGHKLKSLHLYGCNKLTEITNNTNMSMIESIFIHGWTNLNSVTQFTNSIHLTQLNIKNCQSLASLPDLHLPNLTFFMIAFCPLESFPNLQLPNLTELIIAYCQNLASFRDLLFPNLTSLKSLAIRNCPNLNANFPRGHWPPQLSVLKIGGSKRPISEWAPQNLPTSLVELQLFGEHCE